MPSPFPGMDPYLEALDIWPDVHHALATVIRDELNQDLPPPYYARVEMRPELGIVEDEGDGPRGRIIPDVLVLRRSGGPAPGPAGLAVLDRPRRDVSNWLEVEFPDEPLHHYVVEVRDARHDHKLITLIEILSPSNKRPGPDRETYLAKQRAILESDTSLIEIDLLRPAGRVPLHPQLAQTLAGLRPTPDYLVVISRAWRRTAAGMSFQVFPIGLREWLPCIPIPLRREEAEPTLDLQFVFNRVYDGGPYRRGAVDYGRPPEPPLPDDQAAWAEVRLREWAGRPA